MVCKIWLIKIHICEIFNMLVMVEIIGGVKGEVVNHTSCQNYCVAVLHILSNGGNNRSGQGGGGKNHTTCQNCRAGSPTYSEKEKDVFAFVKVIVIIFNPHPAPRVRLAYCVRKKKASLCLSR